LLDKLKELEREGFIAQSADGRVQLTDEGIKLSDSVFERLALES
jgi:Mn-dependent DtxR family transcriptional regulator